jgi:flagellar M-ring protein FliF
LAITQEADRSQDQMRHDVAALVDSQPDDVAQMLQGWLAERKA